MNDTRFDISRRGLLKAGLATGTVLLLPGIAACSSSSSQGSASTGGSGSVLVVAALTTPASVDQDFDTSAQSHEVRMNTMERLMAYGLQASPEQGVRQEDFNKLEPRLAASWELNKDSTEITFHLRKGVKSPWGNPFTAEDVKWTWDRAWALKTVGSFYLRSVLRMTKPGWQVLDDHTIRLRVPEPSPLLESLWINMDLGILDSKAAKKNATADDPWARQWVSKNSPSFAPYQITQWQPGHQVVLSAFNGYYRGRPSISRVVFQEVPESSSRLALLLNGGAQIAEDLAPRDFVQGQKSSSAKAVSLVANSVYRVEFNNKQAPFDQPLVRQALNYAIDRKAIIEGPWDGLAKVCKSPLPPSYPTYDAGFFDYTYDPEKAKSLLRKAGHPSLSSSLSYRAGDAVEAQMAQLIQTDLAKIGVQIQLSEQPASTYLQNILTHKYPMYLYVDSSQLPTPSYALNLWLNSNSAINYSQYQDRDVDEVIHKMLSTVDDQETLRLSREVQKRVMEDPPWIYLVYPGYHVLLGDKVSGFAWRTPVNPIEYWNLKVS